ncbi:zinc finger CCCH domain-containing protein 15 [Artemisia annua]|uniref:Zinc finger CCCH domain-containing protein 15 n=1 Tax=Artemisia annua TaxID=35608 RepID=A0A2U1PCG5_ARTAN|nr:zinc finger CCCH domain-containing protein 15 [Artemisia annua]
MTYYSLSPLQVIDYVAFSPHYSPFVFKEAEALAKKAEASRKREEDIAAGLVQMNGRELFKHEPWVFDNSLY